MNRWNWSRTATLTANQTAVTLTANQTAVRMLAKRATASLAESDPFDHARVAGP
jgi:hypothetical protein